MISEEVKEIAAKIGLYYLEKNNHDYQEAGSEIIDLRIEQILVLSEDEIVIVLARPGLLIGRRGSNLDALSTYIKKKIRVVESREQLIDYLIPLNYEGFLIDDPT